VVTVGESLVVARCDLGIANVFPIPPLQFAVHDPLMASVLPYAHLLMKIASSSGDLLVSWTVATTVGSGSGRPTCHCQDA
jgi:hypothetical protein